MKIFRLSLDLVIHLYVVQSSHIVLLMIAMNATSHRHFFALVCLFGPISSANGESATTIFPNEEGKILVMSFMRQPRLQNKN